MDHFLWGTNPLKQSKPGHEGYIIDTVKNTIFEVCQAKPDNGDNIPVYLITLVRGTGNAQADVLSAKRAARWYDAILISKKVKEAEIKVILKP